LRYPVENNELGVIEHDGFYRDGSFVDSGRIDRRDTLVMACCDPAAGLLAAEMARSRNLRLLVLIRSSRQALTLVSQNLVHVAGMHLARAEETGGNAAVAKAMLGEAFACLRLARWQEGVTVAPASGVKSIRNVLGANLRWVGREPGSGARQCLDEVLEHRRSPRRIARDHRGVAEAVRCGWAEAGVCLRIVSEEAGLGFFPVREEAYDLCYPSRYEDDPRLRALVEVVQSLSYRGLLGELPGYDSSETGELQHVR
jgi:molybdate-binding protein